MRSYSCCLAPGEEASFTTTLEYTFKDPARLKDQSWLFAMPIVAPEKPVLGLRAPHVYFVTKGASTVRLFMELMNPDHSPSVDLLLVKGIKPTNYVEIQLDPKEPPY